MRGLGLVSELVVLACLSCASCSPHGLRRAKDAAADSPQADRGSVRADAGVFRCVPGQTSSGRVIPQLPGPASALALGDLDGDGTTDLAATIESQDVVVIMPGCGGGTFGQGVRLATGPGPAGLAILDVNDDGKLDLAVSNWNDWTISILTATGGGAFSPKVDYVVDVHPHALVATDFDGDGHTDLGFVLEATSDVLGRLRNRGDGTFTLYEMYDIGIGPHSLAAGDLDGDGCDEIAVAGWGATPVMVYSWGRRDELTTQSVGTSSTSVVMADLDGDGHRDLAWSTGRGVKVGLNRGDGTLAPAADYEAGPVAICPPYALTLGDSNGDGKPDLFLLNDDCEVVTAIVNRGDGTFVTPVVYETKGYPIRMATGDVNGDGRSDVVVAMDQNLAVLLAKPDGSFEPPVGP